MSVHIFSDENRKQNGCRSEEEVSPHERRYRPATSADRLLASVAPEHFHPFKSWQKLPILAPRAHGRK